MILPVSICIPAYNEEQNIERILNALIFQKTSRTIIKSIIVISSGSTDKTNDVVNKFSRLHPKVKLIVEQKRNGKSHAINLFLKTCKEPVIVIESADTIPEHETIEKLCLPFIQNPSIGMTGGAPIPINDPNTFFGYIVHTWWWFHRNIPRFGEIVAFRNVLPKITETSAVDEAYIQAKMIQQGYKVVHIDEAIIHNKGPENMKDIIKQRRRIFNGHARLYDEEAVKINNMTRSSLWLLLYKHQMKTVKQAVWTFGGLAIEIYARVLGFYDQKVKKQNPFVWDTASSTKNLSMEYDYDSVS